MKISPVLNYRNSNYTKNSSVSQNKFIPQNTACSNLFPPYIPIYFKGDKTFEDSVVRSVEGTPYWGKGLYNSKNFIDYSKCGWENLSKIPFNITTATVDEIYAFQFANALAEVKDTSWVQRFNPYNIPKPLATFHTLNSIDATKRFAANIEDLSNVLKNKSLDIPITDENGNLIINCVVFDTETTGTNHSDTSKPLDKIIQVGAIQVKNGMPQRSTALSQLIDPKRPIPPEASAVHGLFDEDVKGKPSIKKFLKSFLPDYMNKENGVVVAYNSKFDMGMLKNAVNEANKGKKEEEMLRIPRESRILDPFILIQRIHPYVGAKKRLGEQYKFLFCRDLEGAHDAFADVEGTVDVLKYCLYFLNSKRKDPSKPLTLREVLMFQNGFVPDSLDIKLDHEGARADVNFETSYKPTPIPMDNYYKGYLLNYNILEELRGVIGDKNVKKFDKLQFPSRLILPNDENMDEGILPVDDLGKKRKKELLSYTLRKNFKKALGYLNLQPYNGMSVEEITNLITEKSRNYLPEKAFSLWIKNVNPNDVKQGNDLPDYEISRRVMQEKMCNKK